ncbi:hypothetical protein [Streptomyces sp. NPDC021224]|uniref:hypothetical protein n=1 Tax=unclassified Streptomyces TaxID=2593676 RepID=UPI003794ECCE
MNGSPQETGERPDDDGLDFDWVLTRGADMVWHYAFDTQSFLTDMEAAHAAGDWPLCTAAGTFALQTLVECEARGAGITARATGTESEIRMATSDSPAARALRSLPPAVGATAEDAARVLALVRRHDADFRAALPVEVPHLRSPSGPAQSMRLSASIIKWRKERGLGTPTWGYAALGKAVAE